MSFSNIDISLLKSACISVRIMCWGYVKFYEFHGMVGSISPPSEIFCKTDMRRPDFICKKVIKIWFGQNGLTADNIFKYMLEGCCALAFSFQWFAIMDTTDDWDSLQGSPRLRHGGHGLTGKRVFIVFIFVVAYLFTSLSISYHVIITCLIILAIVSRLK